MRSNLGMGPHTVSLGTPQERNAAAGASRSATDTDSSAALPSRATASTLCSPSA